MKVGGAFSMNRAPVLGVLTAGEPLEGIRKLGSRAVLVKNLPLCKELLLGSKVFQTARKGQGCWDSVIASHVVPYFSQSLLQVGSL